MLTSPSVRVFASEHIVRPIEIDVQGGRLPGVTNTKSVTQRVPIFCPLITGTSRTSSRASRGWKTGHRVFMGVREKMRRCPRIFLLHSFWPASQWHVFGRLSVLRSGANSHAPLIHSDETTPARRPTRGQVDPERQVASSNASRRISDLREILIGRSFAPTTRSRSDFAVADVEPRTREPYTQAIGARQVLLEQMPGSSGAPRR